MGSQKCNLCRPCDTGLTPVQTLWEIALARVNYSRRGTFLRRRVESTAGGSWAEPNAVRLRAV